MLLLSLIISFYYISQWNKLKIEASRPNRTEPDDYNQSSQQKVPCICKTSQLTYAGLILGLHPANGGRCYFVMTALIGWAQA